MVRLNIVCSQSSGVCSLKYTTIFIVSNQWLLLTEKGNKNEQKNREKISHKNKQITTAARIISKTKNGAISRKIVTFWKFFSKSTHYDIIVTNWTRGQVKLFVCIVSIPCKIFCNQYICVVKIWVFSKKNTYSSIVYTSLPWWTVCSLTLMLNA